MMDNPRTESTWREYNSYNTAGVLGVVTIALVIGGWVTVWIAGWGLVVVAAFCGLVLAEATLLSVLAIGAFVVLVASSLIAGRWAAQQGAVLTPWLLGSNALVVVLFGGGWASSSSEPFALMLARDLLGRGLVAVVGWKLGTWTVTARHPNLRPQRPAGRAG